MRLEGWHWVIIIVLALLLFAAPKLPRMARSLGQSMRIFKSEVKQMKSDGTAGNGPGPDTPVEGRVIGGTTGTHTAPQAPADVAPPGAGAPGSTAAGQAPPQPAPGTDTPQQHP